MYTTREVSSTLLVEDVFEPELQRGLANKSETSNVLTFRIACIILFTPIVIIVFNIYIFKFNFYISCECISWFEEFNCLIAT